jgi:hypothetical protein
VPGGGRKPARKCGSPAGAGEETAAARQLAGIMGTLFERALDFEEGGKLRAQLCHGGM